MFWRVPVGYPYQMKHQAVHCCYMHMQHNQDTLWHSPLKKSSHCYLYFNYISKMCINWGNVIILVYDQIWIECMQHNLFIAILNSFILNPACGHFWHWQSPCHCNHEFCIAGSCGHSAETPPGETFCTVLYGEGEVSDVVAGGSWTTVPPHGRKIKLKCFIFQRSHIWHVLLYIWDSIQSTPDQYR